MLHVDRRNQLFLDLLCALIGSVARNGVFQPFLNQGRPLELGLVFVVCARIAEDGAVAANLEDKIKVWVFASIFIPFENHLGFKVIWCLRDCFKQSVSYNVPPGTLPLM